MKKFIALVMMLVTVSAYAGSMFDGMTQEELDNYEIIVRDKRDGMIKGVMSRAKYKVVRIEDPVVTTPELAQQRREQEEYKKEVLKAYGHGYTSLILHGGVGKDGLETEYSNGQYVVSERRLRPVGGVTLCRSVQGTGLCGSAFTNETFLLGVKLDFK